MTIVNPAVAATTDTDPTAAFHEITTELQTQPAINDSYVLAAYHAFQQAGALKEDMYFAWATSATPSGTPTGRRITPPDNLPADRTLRRISANSYPFLTGSVN